LGLAPGDVSKVVLTHLHGDHVNGLSDLAEVPVFVGEDEYAFYRSTLGGLFTRRTTRLPAWLEPRPLAFEPRPLGPFPRSVALTAAGDVIAVPTPGHTGGHLSVVAVVDGVSYVLAGDVTYDQQGLLARQLQGPSLAPAAHRQTLQRVLQFVKGQPSVYLPSHDPQSGARLAARQLIRVAVGAE
jgi:glyoxylase-like metal-dependent hydrolase (beta-lactamase superfamily II)